MGERIRELRKNRKVNWCGPTKVHVFYNGSDTSDCGHQSRENTEPFEGPDPPPGWSRCLHCYWRNYPTEQELFRLGQGNMTNQMTSSVKDCGDGNAE